MSALWRRLCAEYQLGEALNRSVKEPPIRFVHLSDIPFSWSSSEYYSFTVSIEAPKAEGEPSWWDLYSATPAKLQ